MFLFLKRMAYHISSLLLKGKNTILLFFHERSVVLFTFISMYIGYHFFTSFQFLFLFPVTYFSYHFSSLFPALRSRLAEFQPYLWAVSAVPKDTGPVLKLNYRTVHEKELLCCHCSIWAMKLQKFNNEAAALKIIDSNKRFIFQIKVNNLIHLSNAINLNWICRPLGP